MNPRFVSLKRQQLDAVLDQWRAAKFPSAPGSGWIKALREALGMPAAFLAKRLGVVPSSVLRMESSEMDDSISLATLKRAAHALGCDVHYALVPRLPLHEIVEQRAHSVALNQVASVTHTMALEAQKTSEQARAALIKEFEADLLRGSRRGLWK
jgi:predicted DNA-binding mobile mystery protein A